MLVFEDPTTCLGSNAWLSYCEHVSPHIQPAPLLFQLMSPALILLPRFTGKPGSIFSTVLSHELASCCQVPSDHPPSWTRPVLPVPARVLIQPFDQSDDPLLNSVQLAHVFLELGVPKLDTLLQLWANEDWAKRGNQVPRSPGCAAVRKPRMPSVVFAAEAHLLLVLSSLSPGPPGLFQLLFPSQSFPKEELCIWPCWISYSSWWLILPVCPAPASWQLVHKDMDWFPLPCPEIRGHLHISWAGTPLSPPGQWKGAKLNTCQDTALQLLCLSLSFQQSATYESL